MTGRLIVVRHAESATNTEGKIDSAPPGGPLSERGEAQADELAHRLADRRIDRVLCSTATRAIQTAGPIARAHGLAPERFAELCELFCGDLDGRSDPQARQIYYDIYVRWTAGEPNAEMPGGESWNACAARMLAVLSTLPDPPWSGDVVLVSHSGAIRVLLGALLGEEVGARLGYPNNAGCIELRPLGGGRWELGDHDAGETDPFAAFDRTARR